MHCKPKTLVLSLPCSCPYLSRAIHAHHRPCSSTISSSEVPLGAEPLRQPCVQFYWVSSQQHLASIPVPRLQQHHDPCTMLNPPAPHHSNLSTGSRPDDAYQPLGHSVSSVCKHHGEKHNLLCTPVHSQASSFRSPRIVPSTLLQQCIPKATGGFLHLKVSCVV
jgi:hypothetical protein